MLWKLVFNDTLSLTRFYTSLNGIKCVLHLSIKYVGCGKADSNMYIKQIEIIYSYLTIGTIRRMKL